jgi:hypothetical protein
MDHQQNYEYTDPNYGFINSFSGSESFMVPADQQQQLNGKAHNDGMQPLTSFDPRSQTAHYNAEPAGMMFLPEVQPPQEHYPVSYHQIEAPEAINVQKDSIFSMVETPAVVPVNIIQENTQEASHEVNSQPEVNQTREVVESMAATPNEPEATAEQPVPVEQPPQSPSADLPEAPAVISPEQSNMMKALGVMRKEALAQIGSSKKRRRILQLNEDSEEECDLKKELEVSPEKKVETIESDDSESGDEKDPEAFKARSLLKSAVIIQGPTGKKKKRVLDSDEEDEMLTSVDDIGLMESNENENEEELYNNDIIVDVAFEGIGEVVPIENPIIAQEVTDLEQAEEKVEGVQAEESVAVEKVEEKTEEVKEEVKIVKTEEGELDPAMSVEAVLDNIKPMADDE